MTIAPTSKYAVTFIFITVLLDMVGFGLIIPVQPALISQIAHTDVAHAAQTGGLLYGAFSLAQFLFGPTLGNLSEAYGRRPLLLIAVFGLGCDYLIVALAPNITWLFVGRILSGVCGASYVIANAYIADVTKPQDRAKAFGFLGAAFGLGFVIGPVIGGLLGAFGPRVPFFAAAAISLINFVYGYFILPETLANENRRAFKWSRANPLGALKIFRQYKQVMPLCILLGLFFFATSVYPATWPFWATAKFGWGSGLIGLTLAAFGSAMAFTQGVLTGPLVRRFGERNLVFVGFAGAMFAAIAFSLAPSLIFVLAVLIVNAPEGFVNPMVSAILSKAVPENAQGELQGGLSSIMNIASMAGTVFFSLVFSYFMRPNPYLVSPSAGFIIAAGLFLVGMIYFAVLTRQAPPNEPRQDPARSSN